MQSFEHQRHKPPTTLEKPRELMLVCAPLRSNVNLSRIVRVASCCGLRSMIVCGNSRIDPRIARVTSEEFQVITRRSLPPVLTRLQEEGYQLVGLEQTTGSESLHEFAFERRTALVVGNERQGLEEETLKMLDRVVEIPVFGMPYSYNVATAVSMSLYEYCRQFPAG